MRTQPRLLWLIVASLLASSVASVAAVAGTTDAADACSIAGPYAEVWPSTDLRPGQEIEIAGWGFYDILMHEPARPTSPGEEPVAVPPELCDFDTAPITNLDVYWRGETMTWLGSVSGPDFVLSAVVPRDASAGRATIIMGPVELAVSVGGDTEPPLPPCPLAAQPDGSVGHACPEPWPCPLYGTTDTQPGPGADHAPGFAPQCPEPCVDYAHRIDSGTVYDYQWDLPRSL